MQTKLNGKFKWVALFAGVFVPTALGGIYGYNDLRRDVRVAETKVGNLEETVTQQYRDLQREIDALRADIRILLNR